MGGAPPPKKKTKKTACTALVPWKVEQTLKQRSGAIAMRLSCYLMVKMVETKWLGMTEYSLQNKTRPNWFNTSTNQHLFSTYYLWCMFPSTSHLDRFKRNSYFQPLGYSIFNVLYPNQWCFFLIIWRRLHFRAICIKSSIAVYIAASSFISFVVMVSCFAAQR